MPVAIGSALAPVVESAGAVPVAATEVAGAIVTVALVAAPPEGGTSVSGMAAVVPVTRIAPLVPLETTTVPPNMPGSGAVSTAEVLTSPSSSEISTSVSRAFAHAARIAEGRRSKESCRSFCVRGPGFLGFLSADSSSASVGSSPSTNSTPPPSWKSA